MPDETFNVWVEAVGDLQDAEAADLAVVELYKTQSHRPRIADVIAAYDAQRRVLAIEAQEAARSLETPSQGFYSIEAQRRALGLHRIGGEFYHPVLIPDEEIDAAERAAKTSWLALGPTPEARREAASARVRVRIDQLTTGAP